MVKKVNTGVKEKYSVFSVKFSESSLKRLDRIADRYRWSRQKTVDAMAEFYDRILQVLDAREQAYDKFRKSDGEDSEKLMWLDVNARNALGDLCQFGLLGPDPSGYWQSYVNEHTEQVGRKKKC